MNNADALLKSLVTLVTSNGKAVSRVGAQVMVMRRFIDATPPQLTATQCAEMTRVFRHGTEDTTSLMDDRSLPAEYHSTLLEQIDDLLNALNGKSTASP